MRLSQTEIAQFAAWSGDCNPLHVDLPAARQTSYGRTIAHGMLVSLEALRQLYPPDAAPLVSIEAEFHGPVFPDLDYELRLTNTDAGWRLTVANGDQTLQILTAGNRPLPNSRLQSAEPPERLPWTERIESRQVREAPADRPVKDLRSGLKLTGLYDRNVPLAASYVGPITAQQANVLGLCSYLVGMELPGLRSVFTRLQLTFHDCSAVPTPLLYRLTATRFDERFRLLDTLLEVATPAGTLVATAELRSYVRFSPVVTDVRQLAAAVPTGSDRLRDKVALVCGGSRGLGADLAALLALAGCPVYINCRHATEAAERLVAEIQACGGQAELLPGDVADAEWCMAAREQILARHGRLDLLVLNACAPPVPSGFGSFLQPGGRSYVADNLRLVQMPLAALLPTVAANSGAVVAVSSSFVTEPPAEFAEYVALKHAVEGLVRSAAREFPQATYLVPRPPRLQTSWNDTPTGMLGAIPSAQAAVPIVARLACASTAGQIETLEQFPPLATLSAPSGSADQPAADQPAITEQPADLKLIIAASFTPEPLLPGLEFWKRELNWSADLRAAPYGQVLQELLNPTSGMATNPRGLNVVVLRVADWLRELPDETRQSAERLNGFLQATAQEFVGAVRAHRQRAAVETLLLLCPSNSAPGSDQQRLLARIEHQLLAQLRGLGGLGILVAGDFHADYEAAENGVHDPLRDKIAHVPYQDGYLHLLSTLIARYLHRRLAPVRKVVVVDCDNTLWKGVVGEVGAAGVEFEEGHRQLHATLNRLSASGVLVCLCSKNEASDVWSVFEQRDDFGLQREQIVAAMINWRPKSENLRELAARLNLGADSFVFLDDNPVECAEVRAACPEVLTLEWPQQSDEACRLLRHTWELDLDEGTVEDRRRTKLYQEEFRRQELKDQQVSFRDFIERLELAVDIQPLCADDLPRAAQLTLRTNQFNFTTRRREAGELQQLLCDPQAGCHTVRVRDRFGDYGLVGLMITQQRDRLLEVDTFLLSCRVLGRGVEWAMAAELGRVAQQRGAERVLFRVATTSKNAPARQFLAALAPEAERRGDDKLLECELSADYVGQLRFEPDEAAAAGADSAEPRPSLAQSQPVDSLRVRERQIVRAASELATLTRLRAAISATAGTGADITTSPGTELATPGAAPLQADSLQADSLRGVAVERAVHEVFAAALRMPVDRLREVDALEQLGCDSFKIVEITVALIDRFPWLPTTLLFEHRRVSQIVEAVSQLAEGDARAAEADQQRSITAAASHRVPGDAAREIAVVGMHLRCAGARDVDQLWQLLSQGREAVRPVPENRPEFFGRLVDDRPHWAGLIDGVDQFDAEFFGISPREAEYMDPQLRLFLEVAWGALEDAGIAGLGETSDTGVYVGVMYGDYRYPANQQAAHTGNTYRCWEGFSLANRLSQVLNFSGPSLAIDTACSSSGTALHLACQALRAGECGAAVVGGVNLILDPDRFVQLGRLGILSPSGHCRAFGNQADGTLLGEGVGVVVLRPLDEALRRGDRVYGVIKGTGVSTGAGTVGFTVPNPHAQAEAIRRGLRAARIDPRTVTYVETHGTGTALGDPIEVRGLAMAHADRQLWDQAVQGEPVCKLGSIKPNIGHLEAGAGVLGLIKVLLQFQHRQLLPSLTSDEPNPQIPFGQVRFAVQRELTPWERPVLAVHGRATELPRRAGVSSFGVGGGNAHVILEEAPATSCQVPVASESATELRVLTVSARHRDALADLAGRYAEYLESAAAPSLDAVCQTANTRRAAMEYRLAVVAENREQLVRGLRAASRRESTPGTWQGRAAVEAGPPRVVFLFTGQGSQYVGMGRELYDAEPVFRQAVDRCAAILQPLLGGSLVDLLFAQPESPEAARIDQTAITQPALFTIQFALAELWRSWGVLPDAVLGHSVGELAALCVAGGISLEDGLTLVAARGRLMQALPAGGRMVSLQAGEREVRATVGDNEPLVSLAAINSPQQVVVSGDGTAIGRVVERFQSQGVKVRELTVSHAFHSPLMEPMIAEYQAVAATVQFSPPSIRFISCVQAAEVTDEVTRLDYWSQQVRDAVRFADAVCELDRLAPAAYVEIGPQPVLLGLARVCLPDAPRLWLPSIRKGDDPRRTMRESLAQLMVQGAQPNWPAVNPHGDQRPVTLPAYPFRRKRYWLRNAGTAVPRPPAVAESARQSNAELYEVTWKPAARRLSEGAGQPVGHWVVLADTRKAAEPLCRALASLGASASACVASTHPGADETSLSQFDPHCRESLQRALEHVRSLAGPIQGVVSLWGLDAERADGVVAVAEDELAVQLLDRALHTVQALDSEAGQCDTRLWFVTRDAVPAGSAPHALLVGHSALWSFGRVVALEQPGSWGGLIDLPGELWSSADEELWRQVAGELLGPDDEDQVAFRDGQRWVPRLVRRPRPADGQVPIRSDRTYLITGGLGALGRQLATWLIARGARHLLLSSRRGLAAAEAESSLHELRRWGAQVEVVAADVSRSADVARLLAAAAQMPPLAGIIHAAGVDQVQPVRQMCADELRALLAAKVHGGWLLHSQTRHLALEWFVCMSSISSVWGSSGRAHYAAANGFLDALAHQRRFEGLPALSVNWGPWAGGGMATEAALRELEQIGNHVLQPQAALGRLESLLADGATQAVVADIDWDRFRAIYEARRARPLLADLSDAADSGSSTAAPPAEWIARCGELPEHEVIQRVSALLRAEVAQTLGLDDPREIDGNRSFFDMGLDSLLAVELASRLRKRFGVDEPSLIFRHPRIDELSPSVARRLVKVSLESGGGNNGSRASAVAGAPAEVVSPVPTAARAAATAVDSMAELEPKIVAFQRQAYPRRDPRMLEPRWRWMFIESARRLGVEPLLWTHEVGGQVVGFMGGIPVSLKVGGEELMSAWFVETMVLEAYRAQAVGTRLLMESKRDLPFNLSLGQTAEMRGMLLKLGWHQVAPLQTLVLPLRPRRMLAGKFNPLVSEVLGTGLAVAGRVGRLARASSRVRLACREVTQFGAAHDALWGAVSSEYPCAVMRDAGYLNWKYVDQPGQNFLRLELLDGDRVAAVAVMHLREPDSAYRYRRAVLVDLVASPSDRGTLHELFRAVEKVCREHEAASLQFHVIHDRLGAAARRYGFLRREPARYLLVCPEGLSAPCRELALTPDSWLITMGDSDIDRPW